MGDYVERAAGEGCVMLTMAGGHPPIAVPHGGRDRLFGANPLAAGFPTRSGGPPEAAKDAFVLDMATTSVAVGKVLVVAAAGEQLPAGVLVDADGAPSTDPSALSAGGSLTPFGGHKGSALAVLAELLATALIGSPSDGGALGGAFARQAALLVVLRADLWRPLDDVARSAAATLSAVRAARPVEPGVPVLAPGDPEREARLQQAQWLSIDAATLDALLATARQLQVEVPEDLLAAVTQ
jgi:LDH2 family malate/lactate/ureidoglycolate dehydrogenase